MTYILIKNAIIVTMNENKEIFYDMDILIENEFIKEIRKDINYNYNIDKIIYARGCIVLPGLCNTHTHLGMSILRGYSEDLPLNNWLNNKIWPIEKKMTEKTVEISSSLGSIEMIKSGTTSFCDMYYHVDKTAKVTSISGLRGLLSYGMIDNDNQKKASRELSISNNLIDSWNNKCNNRIKIMLGPHATNTCSLDFLEKVKDLSYKKNIGIHIHVLETEQELNQSKEKYGVCPINYLNKIDFWSSNVLAAHCIWLSKRDINILSEKNVNISHNPISNMKLSSGIAPINDMYNHKLNITLGTDSCASNNNLNLFEEIKITPLLQKVHSMDATVLPAFEILKMATSNASFVFNEKIGMIKVGYKADLITIDINKPHLCPITKNIDIYSFIVYSVNGSDVRDSIIDGKIIMENRKVITLDEEKIMEQTQKECEKLLS